MVCTRLRIFVIIFAEMLARQTEAGRGAAEGFSKPCKPFTGILYSTRPSRTSWRRPGNRFLARWRYLRYILVPGQVLHNVQNFEDADECSGHIIGGSIVVWIFHRPHSMKLPHLVVGMPFWGHTSGGGSLILRRIWNTKLTLLHYWCQP